MVRHAYTVLVLGRVHSWQVGVEDVASRRAPITGGATAHIIVSGAAGVDVFRVRSVFPCLAVPGAITVDDGWGEREGTFRTWQLTFSEYGKDWVIV